jgi:dipeptidyl aminopeptidase/acylaminoacyl peptidase
MLVPAPVHWRALTRRRRPSRRRSGVLTVATMLAALATSWSGTLGAQSAPLTSADVMRLKSVGSVELSPDGEQVLYTVSGWEHPNARGDAAAGDTALGDSHERRSHVWMVPFAGGTPRQLTTGERGESQPHWSPDGSHIAFVAARGSGDDGNRAQIWLLPANGGEATQLTNARSGVSGYYWSPDGTRIAYLTTDSLTRDEEAKRKRRDDPQVYEGDLRMRHLWVIDVASKNASQITSGAYTVGGAAWSPDGTRLAFDASPTPLIRDERSNAFVVEIATRRLDRITTAGEVESTPRFSPDGRTLAFTTVADEWEPNADSIMPRTLGNAHLVTWDLAARQRTDHAKGSFDVSVGQPNWSADGSSIWFLSADGVYRSLYQYNVANKEYQALTQEKLISGVSTSQDGTRLAYVLESSDMPGEVHAQQGLTGTARRLTTTNGWLSNVALGRSEVITWKSFDGKPVEGVLLYPVGYTAGTKVPLVVSAHGGPTSAHTNGFKAGSGPGQTWAGRGWAVLYPNPRGSTGYGEEWMRANMQDWGGGDYRDIMTGVDDVIRRGIADSSRMAFEGWSYGGYMTSWVVSQTGRFKAAMMGAGLPSMLSMAGTTDIPGYISTFFNGVPQYDGSIVNPSIKFYLERSAISYTDNVTTPLLILHGANDERVPIGQPMEFYRALKDRGKTTELVFYPREGHGLREYYHQLDRMEREYAWMAKHVLGRAVLQ